MLHTLLAGQNEVQEIKAESKAVANSESLTFCGVRTALGIANRRSRDSGAARGEALVHVEAASINPTDVAGRFTNATLLRTSGRDFAGVVVKGKQHEGEQVWGSTPKLGMERDGSHSEYVVVPNRAADVVPVGNRARPLKATCSGDKVRKACTSMLQFGKGDI